MSSTPMLSTLDNPFNPFTNFEQWLLFDMEKGYNSSAYLDRIANTSDLLSEEENIQELERAIDEIVELDPFELYIKVYN